MREGESDVWHSSSVISTYIFAHSVTECITSPDPFQIQKPVKMPRLKRQNFSTLWIEKSNDKPSPMMKNTKFFQLGVHTGSVNSY